MQDIDMDCCESHGTRRDATLVADGSCGILGVGLSPEVRAGQRGS